MIDQGIPLQQFDMIAAYCVANKCSCLYMDFDNFKKLGATKKATVTTYYTGFLPEDILDLLKNCLLYTSPSPRDRTRSRMPSSA